MRRPWQKKPWPRIAVSGHKSYMVGYYDHEQVERTKTFDRASLAREWIRDYSTAERRGTASLRRFLLDLDAQEANQVDGRTMGKLIELYFAIDAHPSLSGGLAPATFASYSNRANCYLLGHPIRNHRGEIVGRAAYARQLAETPAVQFNEPDAPRRWRAEMLSSGAPSRRCQEAWKVLSAILSWAAGSHYTPEIRTNGCLLANERTGNRRRSMRSGGSGHAGRGRKHSAQVAHWALSPQAVEAVRQQLLARTERRDAILAKRDAIVVSLQYGLGARNQEVWGLR